MEIRSWLTGNRLGTLPFSDECYALADTPEAARELIATAMRLRDERRLGRYEMRGEPALSDTAGRDGDLAVSAGLSSHAHYITYLIPLSRDTEALRLTFQQKMRQMISKSLRGGVRVRRGEGEGDLRECYRLYVLNRKRHGIPPQPYALFATIARRLRDDPEAIVYIAEYRGENVASLLALRYKGVTTGKYEGVDPAYRDAMPIHPLLWTSIRDAAEAGDRYYDMGRTGMDNVGLNEFKTRWGTERHELPYFYYPAGEGLSVVKSASWKYRAFTGLFQRLPYAVTVRLGSRIFRHFG
jgi:lipid II:glycine glycyltransferase (peptidoglycan interpeptide bridge formation enzyme)